MCVSIEVLKLCLLCYVMNLEYLNLSGFKSVLSDFEARLTGLEISCNLWGSALYGGARFF